MTDPFVSIDGVVDSITTTLLNRAKSEDQPAWERLFHIYAPLSYCWARRRGLAREDASDVVQEVFIKVQRKISDFRREDERATFRGWLRVITENTIRDWRRKRINGEAPVGGTQREDLLDAIPNRVVDGELFEARQEVAVLYRQVIDLIRSEFSEIQWKCFWQLTAENRSPADVAADLGITRNQVYLTKSRIIKRVNQLVAER